MRLDGDHDVEIAGRPTALTGLAFAADANLGALIDASGNAHLEAAGAAYLPATAALMAGSRDDFAATLTFGAGGDVNHLAEEGMADIADFARAAAGIAAGRGCAGLGAGAIADRADFGTVVLDV